MKPKYPSISKVAKLIKKTIGDSEHLLLKLVIECWNAKTPHFGGSGPHRYDGNDKNCAYCNRPKDWTPINAGYYATYIAEGEEL